MLETVKQIVKEIEVAEKYLMGMFNLSDLAEADDETVKVFQSYAKLMQFSKQLMIEQAETIDNMNKTLKDIDSKLDDLLVK